MAGVVSAIAGAVAVAGILSEPAGIVLVLVATATGLVAVRTDESACLRSGNAGSRACAATILGGAGLGGGALSVLGGAAGAGFGSAGAAAGGLGVVSDLAAGISSLACGISNGLSKIGHFLGQIL